MEEAWSWLAALPTGNVWPATNPSLTLSLVSSSDRRKSIVLQAERTAGSDANPLVTISFLLLGFNPNLPSKTLWISHPFSLSTTRFPYQFLRQLLQEIVTLAPPSPLHEDVKFSIKHNCFHEEDDEAKCFLQLALICRLFWLCALSAPADAGFLLFLSVSPDELRRALSCRRLTGIFLAGIGTDFEERFARSIGYVIAKWCVLQELHLSNSPEDKMPELIGGSLCYARESLGLLVMKGYAPVISMRRLSGVGSTSATCPPPPAIKYAMAHQQLEAVFQLEYRVNAVDPRFLKVSVRVDNIRLHVVRLGFREEEEDEEEDLLNLRSVGHVATRVKVVVGPAMGSAYSTGPSLGRSTPNPVREVESVRVLKGRFGKSSSSSPEVKAKGRTTNRLAERSWEWEQAAEGSVSVIEGRWRSSGDFPAARSHGRGGRLVFSGDEVGEEVTWRVEREMEGKSVKWRMGAKVWVSFFSGAGEHKSGGRGGAEKRSVEWKEEVELPLLV